MEELAMIFQTFSREEVKPQENDGQNVLNLDFTDQLQVGQDARVGFGEIS